MVIKRRIQIFHPYKNDVTNITDLSYVGDIRGELKLELEPEPARMRS